MHNVGLENYFSSIMEKCKKPVTMLTYMFGRLGFMVLGMMIIACNVNSGGSKTSQNASMSDTTKIDGCQANPVRTKVGKILELKLEAVPGSGYQWLQKDSSQLLKLLDRDSLKFTSPDTSEPTPGLPGHQILHFKVIKEGTETLILEYRRTWESELMNKCEMKIEVSKT
jgi:predicted secreted protein